MKDITKGLGFILAGIFKLLGWVLGKLFLGLCWVVNKLKRGLARAIGFNPDAKLIGLRMLVFGLAFSFIMHLPFVWYAVNYPVSYLSNMTRVYRGLHNMRADVKGGLLAVVPDRIEYAVDRFGNRYGFNAMFNITSEATGHKKIHWTHELMSPWQYLKGVVKI